MKKCNCKCGEVNGRTNEKKYVQLTPEVEGDKEIIGEAFVESLKNFRRKNPNADLSIYKIEVKSDE